MTRKPVVREGHGRQLRFGADPRGADFPPGGVARHAGVVHVYYADRRALTAERVAALVTAEDEQRLTPAMAPRRRAEYLAGRALLRHALAEYTGRDASRLRVTVADTGRPTCEGGPELSVSHSGDFVVCALAERSVGVDVEIGPPRDVAAITERWFTALEAAWVAADRGTRFVQLWVLKEAYLKALGLGLAGGLDALECRIESPRIAARVAAGGGAPQLALLGWAGMFVGVAALGAGALQVVPHAFEAGTRGATAPALELLATT